MYMYTPNHTSNHVTICTFYTFPSQFLLNPGLFRSGRLTFTRKPTAPSIPIPGKNHGYGETEDGSLTPQPLPEQDSTMGPAYYNVSHVMLTVQPTAWTAFKSTYMF